MAIVRSFGDVKAIEGEAGASSPWTMSGGSISLYGSSQTYAAIYRTQPNVRTVIDFIGRNIAQLGLHVFRRVSETDRERLANHDLASWIKHPNPATTRYRLIESLMQDLGVCMNAYWLKVRSESRIQLVRLPPDQMSVEGGLMRRQFVWTNPADRITFEPSEIVHFAGFDPSNPLMGLSPLETLRRVLSEEAASSHYRQRFWENAGRFEGIIERDPDAPKWDDAQIKAWREQWQAAYAGPHATRAGAVAVLAQGMTFKQTSFSAKDAEFISARKLTREEVAAAYHVPLPMVGILDHATFSNIKEQHKHLYQDCLGPWLVMIEEEIERQLLPESTDAKDVYVEFNIAEKMKGSFEEQAQALSKLVGRPIMTLNEGRSRMNLPRSTQEDADSIAAQQGGPSDASAPQTDGEREQAVAVVAHARARQLARLAKVDATERVAVFEAHLDRWNRELCEDLTPLIGRELAESHALVANAQLLASLKEKATSDA